jgi:2-polyprenyl-6-methoxyphenol hydroxylase-like FAD-dependent oxidoreductase
MNTIDTDILICGAGAAGLTLAIDLARRHVGFVLIDKAEQPFSGSRGKGIQPRSLEIFEALGVADRMAAAGGRASTAPTAATTNSKRSKRRRPRRPNRTASR